ncbi:MAG: hypothetical protein ACREDL_23475 [Bradyrhizobium sp.]
MATARFALPVSAQPLPIQIESSSSSNIHRPLNPSATDRQVSQLAKLLVPVIALVAGSLP